MIMKTPYDRRWSGADGVSQKADDGAFQRSLAATALQILMTVDVDGSVGAGRDQPNGE